MLRLYFILFSSLFFNTIKICINCRFDVRTGLVEKKQWGLSLNKVDLMTFF
jgi:hypothetical protein